MGEETNAYEGAALIQISDDGTPQLALIGAGEACGDKILNYANGIVTELQTARLHFTYIQGSNLLCNSDGYMGYYYDYVYRIENGQFVQIGTGEYGDPAGGPQTDANGKEIYEYQWNQQVVSEEQYNQQLNAVYDTSHALEGYDYNALIPMDQLEHTLRAQ